MLLALPGPTHDPAQVAATSPLQSVNPTRTPTIVRRMPSRMPSAWQGAVPFRAQTECVPGIRSMQIYTGTAWGRQELWIPKNGIPSTTKKPASEKTG